MTYVAIGLAIAVLYPFMAGMTVRVLGNSEPCGCHYGYGGRETCDPCSRRMWAGVVSVFWPIAWPLIGLFKVVKYGIFYPARALFRLGRGDKRSNKDTPEKVVERALERWRQSNDNRRSSNMMVKK